MIDSVSKLMPELLPFVMFCYGNHSPLYYEGSTISSQSGVQQGDALGPLLFSLSLHSVLQQAQQDCEWVRAYLDDVVGCGTVADLESFFSHLGPAAECAGLFITETKCELWGSGIMIPDESPLSNIPVADWDGGINLLGSPIGSDDFALSAAAKCLSKLRTALSKLCGLNKPRAAYLILRHSLGACRIIHLLRTCSISVCSSLADDVHKIVFEALSDLIGTSLDECHVTLSSLPLKMGGAGISDTCNILGPAYKCCPAALPHLG